MYGVTTVPTAPEMIGSPSTQRTHTKFMNKFEIIVVLILVGSIPGFLHGAWNFDVMPLKHVYLYVMVIGKLYCIVNMFHENKLRNIIDIFYIRYEYTCVIV